MTCRHFQRLLRSSVQLVLSNSCSKKYFATSPVKFKLELSNQHDVFYHRLYIASIKNITRLSCTPGLVQKYIFITKNTRNPNISGVFLGAANQIWTGDLILTKHQVRVGFGPEFVCPDAPYRVIMCKCRKRDVSAFLAAIRELPNKMLLYGYPDYLTFCADLKKKVQTVRDNGGVLTNETDDTTQEAEQESEKGATCEAAR